MSTKVQLAAKAAPTSPLTSAPTGLLQRKCACDGKTGLTGECPECRQKRITARPTSTDQASASATSESFGHDFGRVRVNEGVSQGIQTKLEVNEPGDRFEREADRVADQVMRSRGAQSTQCGDEEAEPRALASLPVARRRATEGTSTLASVPPSVHEVLRSPGQPLDPSTREFMESRFGHDFTRVRIHRDAKASESAREVNATAFAIGHDVVFREGHYSPSSPSGLHLVAHELTHVLQSGPYGGAPVIQRQFATTLSHGGGISGIMDRDRRAAMDPARHIVSLIRIDQSANRVVIYLASGREFHGSVTTDLAEGNYILSPDTSEQRWNIEGEGGGQRFDVTMYDVDPWQLSYAGRVRLEVGTGNTTPNLGSMTVEERVRRLIELIELFHTGSSNEEEILEILAHTRESQVADFLQALNSRTVGGKNVMSALDVVVDGDNNLILHETISQLQLLAMGSERGAAALEGAPILPWHDVMGFFETKAVFSAVVLPNGKVRVRYLGAVSGGLLTDPRFSEEIDTLPVTLMTGGIVYDADQVFVIHDYDQGRFVPVTAGQLAGFQHLGVRNWLGNVAMVASLAMPLTAARTVAGRAAVIVMERILPAAVLFVHENRLRLVEWFPTWGPRMIRYADLVEKGIAIYGMAQFAVAGWRLFQGWRTAVRSRPRSAPDADAARAADELESYANRMIDRAEEVRRAESTTMREAAPDSPVSQPTSRDVPTSSSPAPSQPRVAAPEAPLPPVRAVPDAPSPSRPTPAGNRPAVASTDPVPSTPTPRAPRASRPRTRRYREAPEDVLDPQSRAQLSDFDRRIAKTGGIESIRVSRPPGEGGGVSVQVEGEVLPSLARSRARARPGQTIAPNFNRSGNLFTNAELGLSDDWEILHLWGPGFGDEAAAGIMRGPREVNHVWQNQSVESYIRELGALARNQGARVKVRATAVSWSNPTPSGWSAPRGESFLKRAEYRISLEMPGRPRQSITVTLDVAEPPTPSVAGFSIDPPNATNLGDLFPPP